MTTLSLTERSQPAASRLAQACTREQRGDRPTPEACAAALLRLSRAEKCARRAASTPRGPRMVGWVRSLNSSLPTQPQAVRVVG